MQSCVETKALNGICAVLILLVGFTRLTLQGMICSYNGLIFALFAAAILIWICQLQRRLLQDDVRRNLIAAALLMIFWMLLRTVKYTFLPSPHFAERYAWYLYYIPMLLIPLLMFLSVLHVGRTPDQTVSPQWKLLYLPAAALIFGMLTNDLHQLAFRFPGGVKAWNEVDCIRGPVYYIDMIWIALLFLAMLGIVLSRCAVLANRKKIWMPMLPFLFGTGYTFCIIWNENAATGFLTAPEMGCFLFASFMESLILTGLLPSNDNYGAFWNASSIGAGIMDWKGSVRYKSRYSLPVTLSQVQEATAWPVSMQEGNLILHSRQIQGWYGYWIQNVSEINRLNSELEELGDVLAEENSILAAENEIAADKVRVEQQNLLYDAIAESIRPQLELLGSLLETVPDAEPDFERTMKYACILNAYIKRRTNLLLLLQQFGRIDGEELRRAILESLDYVRLYGVEAYGAFHGKGIFAGEAVLLTYTLFETALEAGIPEVTTLLVDLQLSADSLLFQMELNRPQNPLPDSFMTEKISALHGTLEIEVDGTTENIVLILPQGGGVA
ncbi:MAG: histidine kinase N-terminal 7TM domain-containing protein [Candidatus Onthomonas sp.]